MTTLTGTLAVPDLKIIPSASLQFRCELGTFRANFGVDLGDLAPGDYRVLVDLSQIQQGVIKTEQGMSFVLEAVMTSLFFLNRQPPNYVASTLEKVGESTVIDELLSEDPVLADLSTQGSLLDETDVDDATLFAELWPLADQVKLDPTRTRKHLLRQNERLKARDYTFDPQLQVWQRCN